MNAHTHRKTDNNVVMQIFKPSQANTCMKKKKKEALTKTSALLLKLEGTKFFGTVLLQRVPLKTMRL